MIRVISTNGMMEERVGLSFEEAQDTVGGLVEVVTLGEYEVLLVNEEGLMMGLTENRIASLMASRLIVGPAVYVEGKANVKAVLG